MSASSSAFQPTVRNDVLTMRIGSFNAGADQSKLEAKSTRKVMEDLDRIVTTCVEEGDLDIFSMCEVGGHRARLESAELHLTDLSVFFHHGTLRCSTTLSYVCIWDLGADASQPGVQQLRAPKVHGLNCSKCDPQLVVQVFSFSGRAKCCHGNLHIRTPTHTKAPSVPVRQRLVTQALEILQSLAEKETQRRNGDDDQPVVCVLVGDPNLRKKDGEEAVQSLQPPPGKETVENIWHVHSAFAEKGGDILYVKGGNAAPFGLPVGASHSFRGVRKDDHDAFGVAIKARVCKKVQTESKAAASQDRGLIDSAAQPVVSKLSVRGTDNGPQPAAAVQAELGTLFRPNARRPGVTARPEPEASGLNDGVAQPVVSKQSSQGSDTGLQHVVTVQTAPAQTAQPPKALQPFVINPAGGTDNGPQHAVAEQSVVTETCTYGHLPKQRLPQSQRAKGWLRRLWKFCRQRQRQRISVPTAMMLSRSCACSSATRTSEKQTEKKQCSLCSLQCTTQCMTMSGMSTAQLQSEVVTSYT